MNSKKNKGIIFMGLAVAINLVGGFIALSLKLPIYIDTIGTILVSILFGPVSGAVVGGLSSIINGITFDPISFYFLPVQLVVGIGTGMLFKGEKVGVLKSILRILLITVLGSATAAVIASFVFQGITSSGSSILVAILKNSGISIITAVFSTQIFTDLLDKAVSFGLVFTVIKMLPLDIKSNIVGDE
ncbi:membrane protein [Clostridium sulfidigenes]|uniref:Membrane protein n=1 Tax=Clostridium sulfidigenes TaxID=318464 RepID=A0A084JB97_9CLOT|nr:ECF transporter S component [Clostridium sulfidigenes]KEZ86231.1 membrane protein [Clostridium sulfidigenes]